MHVERKRDTNVERQKEITGAAKLLQLALLHKYFFPPFVHRKTYMSFWGEKTLL